MRKKNRSIFKTITYWVFWLVMTRRNVLIDQGNQFQGVTNVSTLLAQIF